MNEPTASLDEMRSLLAHLPGPDLEAGAAAAARSLAPRCASAGEAMLRIKTAQSSGLTAES